MKPESETLTAQQSLDIIAQMIQQAKGKVQLYNFYFLFWGWVIVIANLGMYTLTRIDYERPYIVWLITIPAWLFTLYKASTMKKHRTTTSHFDKISGFLWSSYGITIFILVAFGFKINFQLNPLILVVSAIPTIVSGTILNFRPLIIGGITFWLSGIVGFLVPIETQPLIGAVAIVCGYLIPGYLLKQKQA
jgi:hypothetical protein